MRISDWSSDVCSSDLVAAPAQAAWPAERLVDEMLEHLFGDLDVSNHPVAQRAQRLDIGGGLAPHRLGIIADDLDVAHRSEARSVGKEGGSPGRYQWSTID